MLHALDPMCEYGDLINGYNRQKLSCKLCQNVTMEGTLSWKYHLTQIPRHEVGIYPDASP
jgi:hypothetical protein